MNNESNKFAHQLTEGSYKLGMLTIAPLRVISQCGTDSP